MPPCAADKLCLDLLRLFGLPTENVISADFHFEANSPAEVEVRHYLITDGHLDIITLSKKYIVTEAEIDALPSA